MRSRASSVASRSSRATLPGVAAGISQVLFEMKASTVHLEELRGFELADPAVGRQRRGYVAKCQVGVDRVWRPFTADAMLLQQRPNFRRERQPAPGQQRIVNGPESDVIARQHEPARVRVPHRARKRTVESRDAPRTPLLVHVCDQLGVRRSLERMTARYELRAHLGGVGDA